ncbi:hypothetical protein O0L34_g12264 [Tuta absoluta]|nr:hypothetical protein O0L34_g12264 [Tuta absoluta]
MSDNVEVKGNIATSNINTMSSTESCQVFIKIEKLELEHEPTDEPELNFKPQTTLTVSPIPAYSSRPEPSNEVVQIDVKPDIKYLTQNSEDEDLNAPDLEPEVQLNVNYNNITGSDVTDVEKVPERRSSHEAGNNSDFQCQRCQRSFPYSINLLRHQKYCTGPVSLTCPICCQTFRKKKFLKSHMTVHSTEKPYECELCGKQFKHSSAAALHRRRHTEPPKKQFPCSICDKSFSVINALEIHMRSHTNEKPFTCAVCMRAFSHKHNMVRHMQTHDKVVQLKCEICHKVFPRESRLKYHMRVHYSNKKPYNCGFCHKTYSNVQNITRHYKKKHPDHEYIAPVTDAEFANKAWNLHKNQNMSDKEHSSYILPEFEQPNTYNNKNEEEILENPLPEPEMIVLENNSVKLELEEIC